MIRFWLLLLLTLANVAVASDDVIVIGVYSQRDKAYTQVQADAASAYLTRRLGIRVEAIPYYRDELDIAFDRHEVDLIFTHPIHYLQLLNEENFLQVLATAEVSMLGERQGYTSIGGVIAVLADRQDVNSLKDIQGKSIGLVHDRSSLTGSNAQFYEMYSLGIPLPDEQLIRVYETQDRILEALLQGDIEVGFFSTGVLEQLTEAGKISKGHIRIINKQLLNGYDFATSTRLYPQWPILASAHLEPMVVRQIMSVMLSTHTEGDRLSEVAVLTGFAPPVDYGSVETLMKALKITPFDQPEQHVTLKAIWQRYWLIISLLAILIMAIAVLMVKSMLQSRSLIEQKLKIEQIIWGAEVGTWEWYQAKGVIRVNEKIVEFAGMSPDNKEISFYSLSNYLPNIELVNLNNALLQLSPSHPTFTEELSIVRDQNTLIWVLCRGRCIAFDVNNKPLKIVGTIVDITQLKEAESETYLLSKVMMSAGDGVILINESGGIRDCNAAAEKMLKITKSDMQGESLNSVFTKIKSDITFENLKATLVNNSQSSDAILIHGQHKKDGDFYFQGSFSSVEKDAFTNVFVLVLTNITKLKRYETLLENTAYYDELTGLPNRVKMISHLENLMFHSKKKEKQFVLAYIDLDDFRRVNDRFGHGIGDQVLLAIANKLRNHVADNGILVRLGGDEFAVLIKRFNLERLELFLRSLIAAIAEPLVLQDRSIICSASLGYTFYPQPENVTPEQLLRQADVAMFEAKSLGKNNIVLFNINAEENQRNRLRMQAQFSQALEQGELMLYLQPKVQMKTGEVYGFEGLLRWNHPTDGMLAPDQFLSNIEGSEFDVPLGKVVLRFAMQQLTLWQQQGKIWSLSVNISALHFQTPEFFNDLISLLKEYPAVNPNKLELEILETSNIVDLSVVSYVVKQCHWLGIRVSLDDFGSGYSSLEYLKRLPVDTLKIDQGFVRDMLQDSRDLSILQAVIGLSRAFNMHVIAEGVETELHGQLLIMLGCENAQGYAIAKPMPANEVDVWANNWQPHAEWQNTHRISEEYDALLGAFMIFSSLSQINSETDEADILVWLRDSIESKWLEQSRALFAHHGHSELLLIEDLYSNLVQLDKQHADNTLHDGVVESPGQTPQVRDLWQHRLVQCSRELRDLVKKYLLYVATRE